jgi:hypothetical protein
MLIRKFFLSALAGATTLGLLITDANYWIIGIAILFFGPTTLASYAVYLAKSGDLNQKQAARERKIYSYCYFGLASIFLVLAHTLQLPEHLSLNKNLLILVAHLFAIMFVYWLSKLLFSFMYENTIQNQKET